MCFETVLAIAMLTGRILVLPATYRRLGMAPRKERYALHPADFLSLEKVSALHPIVTHTEFLTWQATYGAADTRKLSIEPDSLVWCHPQVPPQGSANARWLDAFASGRHAFELSSQTQSCRCLELVPNT